MGLEGFASIDVRMSTGGRFKAWSHVIRPKFGNEAEGWFFRRGDWVGAEIVVWAPEGSRPKN